MSELVKRLADPIMALPPARRWMVVVAVASILGFGALIALSNRVDYRPLFSNLNSEDAGEIVKKLKDQKVPYRIASDGKAILVPADKVYDLRLSLASDGLPQGGGVGFEIFDRKNFGMTEFVQKLNYQRALQGELARTIMQIAGVEQARVHLAIPEKSLFKDNEKVPTASVVLKMKPGTILRDSEVQGIVHLVASSIEGMDPDQVTLLDSRGKILSRNSPSDATGRMTSTMMETQRSYERNLEDRLQSLLDRAVGEGKSVARVNATLDFKQEERYEEKYDPDSTAVRSEQRSELKDSAPSPAASGIPGVQSNLVKPAPTTTTVNGATKSKSDETLNYEVSHSTAKIIVPVGTLTKLSVAILVDGKYVTPPPGKDGKPGKPKYVPLTPDEMQKLDALVKSAVGFSADRGDQVTVENIPFQDTEDDMPLPAPKVWEKPIFMDLVKNGLLGLGFLALMLIVVRPLVKSLMETGRKQGGSFEPLYGENGEPRLEGGGTGKLPQLEAVTINQQELLETVKGDPYLTAQVLRNWMK